jgi:membrane fusion protein (multidrug efflux system)
MSRAVQGPTEAPPSAPTRETPAPPASPPAAARRRSRRRILIPLAVVLIIAIAAFWYWYAFIRGYISSDDAYIDADRVSISPKVLGRIAGLTVDEGSPVRAGEVLVRLDETTLRAQIDQARANLALAEKSLPLATVALDRASDDFARAELQVKGAVITREQFDHARQALDAAKAEHAAAAARIDLARAQLGVYETMLTDMVLASPIDGIVAKRWLLEGDVAAPGQPVFTVYRTDFVWVTANLEETKVGRIRLGNSVEISVDTYKGRKFTGKVGLIQHYTASQFSLIPPNNASGNFTKVTQRVPLKIFLDDLTPAARAAYPLRPGMSVEIKIRER